MSLPYFLDADLLKKHVYPQKVVAKALLFFAKEYHGFHCIRFRYMICFQETCAFNLLNAYFFWNCSKCQGPNVIPAVKNHADAQKGSRTWRPQIWFCRFRCLAAFIYGSAERLVWSDRLVNHSNLSKFGVRWHLRRLTGFWSHRPRLPCNEQSFRAFKSDLKLLSLALCWRDSELAMWRRLVHAPMSFLGFAYDRCGRLWYCSRFRGSD